MVQSSHPRPNYVAIWAWLLGLLFVSLLAVRLPLPHAATIAIIFLIALAKAALVGAYFMHLKFEKWILYAMIATPLAFFVILTLTLIPDIVFRH